jgi:hypothetical protein
MKKYCEVLGLRKFPLAVLILKPVELPTEYVYFVGNPTNALICIYTLKLGFKMSVLFIQLGMS